MSRETAQEGKKSPAPAAQSPSVIVFGPVGLAGQEGDLFRKVLKWSILLVLVICVLVYLQSTAVLDWMVVK